MWSSFVGTARRASGRLLAAPGCRRTGLDANARGGSLGQKYQETAAVVGNSLVSPLGATRGFYFPRNNWFPWRTRLIHQRQAAQRKQRHRWPRYRDDSEAPIFLEKEAGNILGFRDKEIRLGLKRLDEFARLVRGRQLQDAIDWVESSARMKAGPILKLLRRAMKECTDKHKWDAARIYIWDVAPQRGYFIKSLRKHTRGNFGIQKSPRHMFLVRVREMPIEEFFHRIFVFNKVPRSIAADMRLALHEKRVSSQMIKEWAPYLCASSRGSHRKELKWLDGTRQFDYYKVRRDWIRNYKANLGRSTMEAREARGLPPLPAEE